MTKEEFEAKLKDRLGLYDEAQHYQYHGFKWGAEWAFEILSNCVKEIKQEADRHKQALDHINEWHNSHL